MGTDPLTQRHFPEERSPINTVVKTAPKGLGTHGTILHLRNEFFLTPLTRLIKQESLID